MYNTKNNIMSRESINNEQTLNRDNYFDDILKKYPNIAQKATNIDLNKSGKVDISNTPKQTSVSSFSYKEQEEPVPRISNTSNQSDKLETDILNKKVKEIESNFLILESSLKDEISKMKKIYDSEKIKKIETDIQDIKSNFSQLGQLKMKFEDYENKSNELYKGLKAISSDLTTLNHESKDHEKRIVNLESITTSQAKPNSDIDSINIRLNSFEENFSFINSKFGIFENMMKQVLYQLTTFNQNSNSSISNLEKSNNEMRNAFKSDTEMINKSILELKGESDLLRNNIKEIKQDLAKSIEINALNFHEINSNNQILEEVEEIKKGFIHLEKRSEQQFTDLIVHMNTKEKNIEEHLTKIQANQIPVVDSSPKEKPKSPIKDKKNPKPRSLDIEQGPDEPYQIDNLKTPRRLKKTIAIFDNQIWNDNDFSLLLTILEPFHADEITQISKEPVVTIIPIKDKSAIRERSPFRLYISINKVSSTNSYDEYDNHYQISRSQGSFSETGVSEFIGIINSLINPKPLEEKTKEKQKVLIFFDQDMYQFKHILIEIFKKLADTTELATADFSDTKIKQDYDCDNVLLMFNHFGRVDTNKSIRAEALKDKFKEKLKMIVARLDNIQNPKLDLLSQSQLTTVLYEKEGDYGIAINNDNKRELEKAIDQFLRKKL